MTALTLAERQVLAELELCSHGTISSYQPVATKSGASSKLPPAADAPHHKYRDRLLVEHDPLVREAILEAAREELSHLRRRAEPPAVVEETPEQFDRRIREKLTAKWSVAEVAIFMRCTPTRVRQAAAADDVPEPDDAWKTTRAREMAQQGLTVRHIASHLKMSKSTVQRVIRRAA